MKRNDNESVQRLFSRDFPIEKFNQIEYEMKQDSDKKFLHIPSKKFRDLLNGKYDEKKIHVNELFNELWCSKKAIDLFLYDESIQRSPKGGLTLKGHRRKLRNKVWSWSRSPYWYGRSFLRCPLSVSPPLGDLWMDSPYRNRSLAISNESGNSSE
ncbi:hypothetical protein SNEBB_011419 [Seison nebaliae]|nr:hypothetical protein SNEBB_011419 [Seison nebaliae]